MSHLLRIEKMLQKDSQSGSLHSTKENVNHEEILNRHSMRLNRSEFPSSFSLLRKLDSW